MTAPLPPRPPSRMAAASMMIASQVLVVDQAVHVVARRTVPVLSEKPLTDWLGLIWQTLDPGHSPSSGLRAAWIAISVVVILGLARLIRRAGPTLAPIQAVAMGLLLGGSLSHLVDLLRWGEVVATLHVRLPHAQAVTGVARLAQWAGLLLVIVGAVRRRNAIS